MQTASLTTLFSDLFDTIADGTFHGLAFDWIAGNVYLGTTGGFILACDTVRTSTLTCGTVMNNQGEVNGIALSPVAG